MIRRANRRERTDVRAAAEALVGEVDVLTEPSVGSDLCDHLVDGKRLAEPQLVRLEKLVAGASGFIRIAQPITPLMLAVRSKAERQKAIKLTAILQRVILAHREDAHPAEETALRTDRSSELGVVLATSDLSHKADVLSK